MGDLNFSLLDQVFQMSPSPNVSQPSSGSGVLGQKSCCPRHVGEDVYRCDPRARMKRVSRGPSSQRKESRARGGTCRPAPPPHALLHTPFCLLDKACSLQTSSFRCLLELKTTQAAVPTEAGGEASSGGGESHKRVGEIRRQGVHMQMPYREMVPQWRRWGGSSLHLPSQHCCVLSSVL